MFYRLLRALLFLFPAETAHHLGSFFLRLVQVMPGARGIVSTLFSVRDPVLETKAFGLTFPNPLGIAAGFDKDAKMYESLGALGFGFVEVGTLTPKGQPGNPKPRMFRLPADRALINRLGFNNGGAEEALPRLKGSRHVVVGVNIGKNKVTAESDAVHDYVACAEKLAPLADYLVVNVSSPNTPGLRNLQATEALRPILRATREAMDRVSPNRRVPLLVKIAPDLADEDVDAVAALALELQLDGIIATNTTISRAGLQTPEAEVQAIGAGGVSGAPVKRRSVEMLKRLRSRVGDRLVLISVGGVENADDAWERIQAGATLVQAYTGFIYGGPAFAQKLTKELAAKVRAAGVASVQAAIGAATRDL